MIYTNTTTTTTTTTRGRAITSKRTSIGRGRVKLSSMNKHKRKTYKAYRGQGK